MFAVLGNTIQHFPAQNLAYYIEGDFEFYTDSGEKIDRKDLNTKAEEEIKEHTIGDSNSAIQSFRAGQVDNTTIPYRIYGIGKVNDDPMQSLMGGDNNG